MSILDKLDEELDRRNNPKLILLGTEEYRTLDRTLSELGDHTRPRTAYSGISIVRVTGRSSLLETVEGDPQCSVRADVSDFTKLLKTPPIVTDAIRAAIRKVMGS